MSFSQATALADRYRLDCRIAVGGMGEVWRAVDLVLDRPVAVKLMREEYAQHPETLARFRAEARHTAALSHPGIAQMYDYGEAGPAQPPFLVMELVDGPPLTRLLARGPLDPAQALDVIAQAAAGLGAAHAAGLVHRDIKPGNLLVGSDGLVKITDFGIAHAAGSAPLTRTGALIGTPAFLAPERVAGASAAPASDLYSLGIVAYQCLAGAMPFTGTPVEVALAHQYRSLPPLPPAVPPAVTALVTELTARDPAQRPASAADVAARAAGLRDAMNGGAPRPPGSWLAPAVAQALADRGTAPGPLPPTLAAPADDLAAPAGDLPAGALPATLREARTTGAGADPSGWAGPAGPPGRRGDAARPARRGTALLLAAAATAAVVGLGGWLIASRSAPPAAPAASATRHPGRPRPTTAAGLTVEVNANALTGQPETPAARQLRQLGLRVHVTWVLSGSDPGTVLSVAPSGKVRVGTIVVLTAATRPFGEGHDHHHHGDGGDGGNGGNGGGNGGGD